MEFEITRSALEELVASGLSGTCTFDPDVLFSVLNEDIHLLATEGKSHIIDKVIEVAYRRTKLGRIKVDERDIYRLAKRPCIIGDAHTHYMGNTPSRRDLQVTKMWEKKLKNPWFLVIVGNMMPYTFMVWENCLDIPHYLSTLDAFVHLYFQEMRQCGQTGPEYENIFSNASGPVPMNSMEIMKTAKRKLEIYRREWVQESIDTFKYLMGQDFFFDIDCFWEETLKEVRNIRNLTEFLNLPIRTLERKYSKSQRGRLIKNHLITAGVDEYLKSVSENVRMYDSEGKEVGLRMVVIPAISLLLQLATFLLFSKTSFISAS